MPKREEKIDFLHYSFFAWLTYLSLICHGIHKNDRKNRIHHNIGRGQSTIQTPYNGRMSRPVNPTMDDCSDPAGDYLKFLPSVKRPLWNMCGGERITAGHHCSDVIAFSERHSS